MLRRGEFAHTWAMSSVSLSQTFSAHRMTLDFGAERAATIFPNALPCPARRSLPISQRLIDNSQRPKAEVLIQQSRQPRALRLVSEPVCRNVQAFVGVRLCTRGSELPRRAGALRPPRELADRPETSAPVALSRRCSSSEVRHNLAQCRRSTTAVGRDCSCFWLTSQRRRLGT